MLKCCVVCLCLLGGGVDAMIGQAVPTASRRADLQVGVGFTGGKSDYDGKMQGIAFYATLDVTNHFGGEFVLHQENSRAGDKVYERTYELGGRYHREYGRFSPYAKVMYGRGVFNYPQNSGNLAYNLYAGGLGTDFRLNRFLNLRADYEYQRWLSFPPTGLVPQLAMVGIAYHFPGGLKSGKRLK